MKGIKNLWKICVIKEMLLPLHTQKRKMVPWMSGLVSGLQNRVRRFESARDLKGKLERLPFFVVLDSFLK